MTSSNPPFPYYNGIAYNSAFFTSIDSGLTIAQANTKYLQKTVTDTATALETFNGGLQTSTLTSSGISTFLSESFHKDKITIQEVLTGIPNSRIELIPSSAGVANVKVSTVDTVTGFTVNQVVISSDSIEQTYPGNSGYVFTGQNIDLNVGTGARNTFGVVHHYSDCDNAVAGAGVHLNNGLSNESNTNIHNGASSSGIVNIATGSSSSTEINIGNEATTDTTNTIRGNTTITKLFTNSISATSVSAAPNLFNNTTTGNMQIGQAQTSGTLSIGGGTNRNGTIFIGTVTKGNISIGNAMTAGTNTIVIGTASLGNNSLRGANVKLNETGTGNIEFGNASTGTITLFKPLTPNYNATYSGTTGTGVGKIGEYKKPFSAYGVGLTSGTPLTLNSFSLTAGVWLCTGNVTTGSAGAPYNALSFSLTTNTLDLTLGAMNFPAYSGYTYNLCCTYTFSFTATTTVYLIGQVGANDTWSYPVLTATRLA